jgi:hypothetical protein
MFLIPAVAQGAHTGTVRSGAASDPIEGALPFDATRVEVLYDRDHGRLEITVWMDPSNPPVVNQGGFGGTLRLSVGSSTDQAGNCITERTGDLELEAYLAWDLSYNYGEMIGVPNAAFRSGNTTEDFPRYVFPYEGPSLVGRDYRCVTHISMGDPADTVNEFFFSGFEPPKPTIRWASPPDGATVAGRLTEGRNSCWLEATGGIVSTANYVDGLLNDVQTRAPWGCEIDTTRYANGSHSLQVRAYDAIGREVARDTIRVRFNNESPPPPRPPVTPVTEPGPGPAPDPTPAPHGPVVVVPGQSPIVKTPRPQQQAGSLTSAQSQRQSRRALRRVFKKAFINGSRHRQTCRRVTKRKHVCAVSWRYKRYRYSGKVVIKLQDANYVATVDVKRRRR